VVCGRAVGELQLNKDNGAGAPGLSTTDRMFQRDIGCVVFRWHVVFSDCHACRLMSSVDPALRWDAIRPPFDVAVADFVPA
jgi:hypothetical protein